MRVNPGAAVAVTIRFTPTAAGAQTAQVFFYTGENVTVFPSIEVKGIAQ